MNHNVIPIQSFPKTFTVELRNVSPTASSMTTMPLRLVNAAQGPTPILVPVLTTAQYPCLIANHAQPQPRNHLNAVRWNRRANDNNVVIVTRLADSNVLRLPDRKTLSYTSTSNTAEVIRRPNHGVQPLSRNTLSRLQPKVIDKVNKRADVRARIDVSDTVKEDSIESENEMRKEMFPKVLYRLLEDAASSKYEEIVCFLPHGRAFIVHDTEKFETIVMPRYFKMSVWKSFRRQLNLYDFTRIACGHDRGSYYHKSFVRGKPELLDSIRRTRLKGERSKNLPGYIAPKRPNFCLE